VGLIHLLLFHHLPHKDHKKEKNINQARCKNTPLGFGWRSREPFCFSPMAPSKKKQEKKTRRNFLLDDNSFEYVPKCLENRRFLGKIKSHVLKLVNAKNGNDEFLFISKILAPLVERVFEEGKTTIPGNLDDFCLSLFDGYRCLIQIHGCAESAYGQAIKTDIGENLIMFNTMLLSESEIEFENTPETYNFDDNDSFFLNASVVFCVVQWIYRMLHTFTDDVLDFESTHHHTQSFSSFSTASSKKSKVERFCHTPVRVGIKLIENSRRIGGDMGYGGEEFLLGNLRLHVQKDSLWRIRGIWFEEAEIQETTVTKPQKQVSRMKKNTSSSKSKTNALKGSSKSSKQCKLNKITVQRVSCGRFEFADDYAAAYVARIHQLLEHIEEGDDGTELYDAFEVDRTELEDGQRFQSIVVPQAATGRKNAGIVAKLDVRFPPVDDTSVDLYGRRAKS
jgi:hypothetical protein